MKTLYDVPWDDGSGTTFQPSRQQVERGTGFLKHWDVPIEWITHVYAHNPENNHAEDKEFLKLCGTHPNVPEEANGFYLKNSESDQARGQWCWENN